MKIYDTFIFHNELRVAELRLDLLFVRPWREAERARQATEAKN